MPKKLLCQLGHLTTFICNLFSCFLTPINFLSIWIRMFEFNCVVPVCFVCFDAMNLLNLCMVNQIFAITTGVFVNGLLLWLICCASTNNLRSYTRILKLHCLSDLFYILILQITSLVSLF